MGSQRKAIAILKPRWKRFAMQTAFGIAVSIVLTTSMIAPTLAKPAAIPGLELLPIPSGVDSSLMSSLDQPRLEKISQDYFQSDSSEVQVKVQRQFVTSSNNPSLTVSYPDIYVNNQRLFTVTDLDAQVQGENDPQDVARRLSQSLEQDLRKAKQERQAPFLLRQGAVASGVFLSVILCSWLVRRWQRRLRSQTISTPTVSPTDSVTTQLSQQQQQNLQEARVRLFQIAQTLIWGSGTLVILSLFPHTRTIPVWIISVFTIPVFKVPALFGIVALGTYVVIRLSYVLIDRFTTALVNNALLGAQDSYVRLQLRVTTISGVTKGIATLGAVVIGTLLALSSVGVNIVPLIAGAGLIGVAVSLASQSLIKDAINGFLIIVEDQYAIGDVINVGDVGGMVENLNLRITQVRDAEGRLITIPNSEIKTVANLSSRWSRVDLLIPISYDTDIDQAMKLIDSVGLEMDRDPQWREPILERPQVLGVENFGDRGLMIRVWIKTQPLKQWDVAREFRRRLKVAFDRADIAIPVPQQAIWLNTSESLKFQTDGKDSSVVGK